MKARREWMNEKFWLLLMLMLLVAASGCNSGTPSTNAPANSANAPTNPANTRSGNNNASAPAPPNANAATGAPVAPKLPLEGIVKASAEKVEVRAGASAKAAVVVSVASGYHINSNPATERFLIATLLGVKPEPGIIVNGIAYPKPLKKKFAFAEVPLAVYEGDVKITFAVHASRDAVPGQHALAARVRLQPCDDEKCYPPMNVETSIPVTIR